MWTMLQKLAIVGQFFTIFALSIFGTRIFIFVKKNMDGTFKIKQIREI